MSQIQDARSDPYHYGVIGRAIETIAARREENLSLEEVAAGCIKLLQGSVVEACPTCSGSGHASKPLDCETCAGQGTIHERTWFGWFGAATDTPAARRLSAKASPSRRRASPSSGERPTLHAANSDQAAATPRRSEARCSKYAAADAPAIATSTPTPMSRRRSIAPS